MTWLASAANTTIALGMYSMLVILLRKQALMIAHRLHLTNACTASLWLPRPTDLDRVLDSKNVRERNEYAEETCGSLCNAALF